MPDETMAGTRIIPHGQPCKTQINAVLLSLSGSSRHRIAFLVRVSAQSVLNWIRAFATAYDAKPAPPRRTIVPALDEMGHDVQEKRQKLGIWKALDWETGQLLDWEGNGGPHYGAVCQVLGQWKSGRTGITTCLKPTPSRTLPLISA